MSGVAAHPGSESVKHVHALMTQFAERMDRELARHLETVCELAAERLQQLEAPRAQRNGPLFFDELEGELVKAHDGGHVNESALLEVLKALNSGQILTLDELARVFGIETIYPLLAPTRGEDRRDRIDRYRSALLTGIASAMYLDGRPGDVEIVDRAESLVRILIERKVL